MYLYSPFSTLLAQYNIYNNRHISRLYHRDKDYRIDYIVTDAPDGATTFLSLYAVWRSFYLRCTPVLREEFARGDE